MNAFLYELRRAPLSAKFGCTVVLFYIAVAIFAPVLAPFGESEVVGYEYQAWSTENWLGTDSLGRDMATRMIYGARNTIGIALVTTIIAFAAGSAAGFFAAVMQGWVDQALSRAVDVVISIPTLIFALLLLTIFGASVTSLVGVIALIYATFVYRIARAVAMGIVVMDYVEAAQVRGEGLWWIMRKEILPNAAPPLVAEFGLRFCFVFLTISGLSFLGLGIQPPAADWGSMVRENASLITFGDLTPLIPAAAIGLLTVAVNFIVDWMLHKASGLKT